MPHSYGYRARTRRLFKRGFKEHGPIKMSTYLTTYRKGDLVDIKTNSAQQKGMPHKYYHGHTGVVFNITPSAVGVIVNKIVGNRYIEKRISVRVEHVKHSRSREEFVNRVKENEKKRAEARKNGETKKLILKRIPAQPRTAHIVSGVDNLPQTIVPLRYETTI
ncbi:ribosomal protein L21e-domain-containing protein [Cantharellus anzutake]|uniref:ribosomal protein L21e-domain-containing protein n=1 Tax=Cantharellus anzutake TaxID=1750568 RepID=UPI00190862FC|nr:ribosomal protein L21e-domain-containing protein [Cantharellus anzutake]KAF8327582.1 ribosomal protein L21e-domain-containing protein [Cantharellus anzutake]